MWSVLVERSGTYRELSMWIASRPVHVVQDTAREVCVAIALTCLQLGYLWNAKPHSTGRVSSRLKVEVAAVARRIYVWCCRGTVRDSASSEHAPAKHEATGSCRPVEPRVNIDHTA